MWVRTLLIHPRHRHTHTHTLLHTHPPTHPPLSHTGDKGQYDSLIGGTCIDQLSSCINIAKHGEIVSSKVFRDMVVKVADMEIDTDVHKCFDPIEPENESSALAKHYQVMYVQTMAFTEQTHKVRSQESISSGSVASEYVLEDLLDDYTNKSKSSTLWRVARMFVCTKRDIRVRPTQLQNAKFRLAGLVTDVSICEDSVREQFRMHKMGKLDSLALRQSRIQLPNIEEKEVEKEEDLDFLIRRSSSNVKKKNLERRASKKMKNEREAMVEVLMHEQMLVFAENDDNENADDNNKSKIDGRRAQYRIALRGNVHAVARDATPAG